MSGGVLIAQHPGGTSSGHAGQAIKAVNRDPGGTPVGKLNTASDLLFLSAITAGTAPAKCGRSQKKGTTRGCRIKNFFFCDSSFFHSYTEKNILFSINPSVFCCTLLLKLFYQNKLLLNIFLKVTVAKKLD